jgi:beta-glucosidase
LAVKVKLGLFEDPFVDEDQARTVLVDPAHRDVARKGAQRAAVLLRNEADLLPLKEPRSIAVVGPLADSKRDTLGPWVFDHDVEETVTILQGIRDRAGGDVRVDYAPGIRPAYRAFASMFDMFGGNTPANPEGFEEASELERAPSL